MALAAQKTQQTADGGKMNIGAHRIDRRQRRKAVQRPVTAADNHIVHNAAAVELGA